VIMDLIQAATAMGATLIRACECLGLSIRTIQRWREEGGGDDQRRGPATTPHNKLSAEEEAEVLRVATSADFADLSPNQIVPHLATHGTYIGSESTIYRRLHAAGMMRHRGRARAPSRRPRALTATGPDQLYSWDITYLPTKLSGRFVYLYMIIDIWSRKIIAAEVHERECGAIAADLVERTCAAPARSGKPLWLHSDNGAPMRGSCGARSAAVAAASE
jgi:putative transposase